MGDNLGMIEEKFMASIVEKVPVIGRITRATGRAYTSFLNKLRADVFSDIVSGATEVGKDLTALELKEISSFVNAASGRGSLGVLEKAAPILNGVLFSPRLMASRIHFMNPVNYVKASPVVRKEMLKSMFSIAGYGLSIIGLAKLAGAKIGTDPTSSDLGKMKVGDTRIDIWGGYQQYIRMFAQLYTGKYTSSTSGKEIKLGEGYKPLTRWDILWRQIESKESPIASLVTDILKQQNYAGEKINIPKELGSRFVPMLLGDLYDLYNDDPKLLPLSIVGMFGAGLQTYKPKSKKIVKNKRFGI
jgi:hypothetical protein